MRKNAKDSEGAPGGGAGGGGGGAGDDEVGEADGQFPFMSPSSCSLDTDWRGRLSLADKLPPKARRQVIKLPWEVTTYYSNFLSSHASKRRRTTQGVHHEDEDAEDEDEDEMEANEDLLTRLRVRPRPVSQ